MRIRVALAVVTVLAALAPLSFAAFEPKGEWDGFGQGSWVLMKTTSKTITADMQVPDTVTEMRKTLTKVTDAEWVVTMETKAGDTWGVSTPMTLPRVAPKGAPDPKDMPKVEELGADKVTIEGKDYACKKQKVSFMGDVGLSWVSEEHGELKWESTEADGSTTRREVTSLAKKVKAAGKEVTCRETKTVAKPAGIDTTIVVLASDDLPGHLVRMESTEAGAVKTNTVTEVVAFEIK